MGQRIVLGLLGLFIGGAMGGVAGLFVGLAWSWVVDGTNLGGQSRGLLSGFGLLIGLALGGIVGAVLALRTQRA